ncbi:molybdenum cofactor synthesis 2A [Rhynchophorus ferrugineus]|uniref:Molybdopterin synthase sulfur carrier subunit n=1 Tax=Rhynchophorus ferrugineus TaxID=354439 RepID=A0A834MD07_RHYFE|nr:hypothetical protein GWI33_006476 [Rhynchophorus ferrugineus]
MRVKVKVLFFAQAKEIVGKQSDCVEVCRSISCLELINELVKIYSLEKISNNILLSVNEELYQIDSNLSLKEGDEIAIIPPLSGG